jgi:hypothetical protein
MEWRSRNEMLGKLFGITPMSYACRQATRVGGVFRACAAVVIIMGAG